MVIADALLSFAMFRYDMVNVEYMGDQVYMGWSFDGGFSHENVFSGTLAMNGFEKVQGNYPDNVANPFCLVNPPDDFTFSKFYVYIFFSR